MSSVGLLCCDFTQCQGITIKLVSLFRLVSPSSPRSGSIMVYESSDSRPGSNIRSWSLYNWNTFFVRSLWFKEIPLSGRMFLRIHVRLSKVTHSAHNSAWNWDLQCFFLVYCYFRSLLWVLKGVMWRNTYCCFIFSLNNCWCIKMETVQLDTRFQSVSNYWSVATK